MVNLDFIKRKFSRFVLFCFLSYFISYFVPFLIPDSNAEKDRRLHFDTKRTNGANYVEGEVLVRFKPKVNRQAVDAIAESNLSTVARRYNALTKIDSREYAYLKSKHRTTQQMVQALRKNPHVEAVSANFFHHIDAKIPNDQNFSYLWGLHNTGQMGGPSGIDIDAPEAWDINTGSSSVIVGIIDTGIDYNHPDLIPNLWINPGETADGIDNDGNGYVDDIHGINAITANGDPLDDHSHGTHCAGTVGAVGNNNLGVAGLNWNIKLIGAKFLDATGYGTDADAIECINYLIDLKTTYGQNIVAANSSFGGGDYDPVMESAINNLGTAGIIFCAAAGNDWMDNDVTPHYPSSYDCFNIISVTAVDWMGWQNFNYGATSVDLGAPGVDILSTISAVYYPQAGDIFFDDMESGADKWITGGVNNSWGITTDQEIFEEPLYPVPSPPHFWSDSPGAPYLPDTDSWFMNSSDIDLSAYLGQNLYLGFGSAMLLEPDAPVDHGYVEVSGDGGSTWHALMDFAQCGYYWYIPWYFLIPDSVKTSSFRFRFHLVTDFSIEYDGWLIDDVGIGTADFYGYGFKSGTSMAAPHVTGAVALIAAQYPFETVTARINRILNNVTPLPSLIDTCVTEGMLNLYAALTSGVGEYTLSISTTAGGTTNPGPGTYPYIAGTSVEVSAITDTGYSFSHWSGDVPSGYEYDNPVTITMDSNKVITANFVPEIIKYTLDISATSGGTTNPSPGIYTHDSGTDILISALADSGNQFLNWAGDIPAGHENDNPVTITMDSNKSITANFIPIIGRDDILGTWNTGVWYRNTETGSWVLMATPAQMVAAGDLDGDGIDDLVGVWSSGLWVKYSSSGNWAKLSTTLPTDIASGDMNGDGRDDILGSWPSGVWYRNTDTSAWVKITTPAEMVASGDVDGDGIDDLIGVWSSGLWVKHSSTNSWLLVTPTLPTGISSGDMNGDGRDDILGTWVSGVWYKNSIGGDWVKISIPANLVAAGDMDGDSTDDLIGTWNNGLWVKNSSTAGWEFISTSVPSDIDTGLFRAGWDSRAMLYEAPVVGVYAEDPSNIGIYKDQKNEGPRGGSFASQEEESPEPGRTGLKIETGPTPGESGF